MNRDERTSGSQPGVGAPDPMVGQVLDGRYRLIERLGEGGMGEVYAAEHVHIEKRVAIKLLRSEILTNQEAVTRFRQEARSASSIGHKNIIAIEDFGQLPDGRIYLAMELLNGSPLNELLKTPLTPERILHILIQTGHGLAAAHKKGIVHRDMKPENVFVTLTHEGEDVPKLLDFGIAKVSGADGNNHLTRTGTIFGTPFYMAPEQALGQNVDHRADIYAMGVIMYEVFGGAVPFQGESFMGILTQHITAEPKPPARMAAEHGRTLPPGVEEIILRAMRKDPDQRYQTMDELVAALVGAYRGQAGAGMSSYLPSHGAGGSGAMQAAGGFSRPGSASQPPIGPHGPTHTPSHYASTPMPGGGAPYSLPHPDPQFTGQGSGLHAVDRAPAPPPKSKAGLIAILFVVMAAIGGGVALLVLKQQNGDTVTRRDPDGTGTTGTSGTAGAGGTTGTNDTTGTSGTTGTHDTTGTTAGGPADAGVTGTTGTTVKNNGGKDSGGKSGGKDSGGKSGGKDSGGKSGGKDSGGKSSGNDGDGQHGNPAAADAGVTGPLGDGGGDHTVDGGGAAVAKVVVLVNSRPSGAEIFGPDGASLGKTPTNVWVEPGQSLEVTLKLRGRKDIRTTLDDQKKKVTLRFERPPVRPPDPGDRDGSEDDGAELPRDVCHQDPNSVECRCKKNPDLPECGLE